MTARDLGPTLRDQIEQDRALGRCIAYTCERLGVTEDEVLTEWADQDEIAAEIDKPAVNPASRRPRPPCGTVAAYQQHKQYHEDACDDCMVAQREYRRELKRRKAAA